MELRNLLTFSKIAELNSFSGAANALGYAQSTVTMQIKQLESETNTQLFERINKKIYLTKKGKKLLDYANQIILLNQEAVSSLLDEDIPKGEIVVGVVESICSTLLPKIIMDCNHLYPDIEIVVKIATTSNLLKMLHNNEVDLIITIDKKHGNSNYITSSERPEQTCFVIGANSPYANMDNLTLLDIIEEKFIMPEKECNCRQILEDKLLEYKSNENLKIFLEIGSTGIIKSFVENSLVISLLPKITIIDEIKSGKIKVLDVTDMTINVWIQSIYHKNKYITPAMKALLSIVNKEMELLQY